MAKDQINKADFNSAKIDKPITDDPKLLENQKKSLLSAPSGPSSEERGSYVKWEKLSEMVGQPFDTELVPFSKLRQMRNDPMIGMGLYYSKVPLIRAKWKIDARDKNGVNAQVAAFIDAAFRPTYASFVNKYLISYDFGFSAMEKQFKFEDPGAYYVDPKDPTSEKPCWTDSKIPPIVFKEFVTMPPEKASPVWDPKTGEFLGIKFDSDKKKKAAGGKDKPDIDIYKALWATNDKEKVFGSLYGYPKIAYAYQYWWRYWHDWYMNARSMERQAIPALKVKYPEGTFKDADGVEYDNLDIAILAGQKIRSNGTVALPSGTNNQGLDKISNTPQWDVEYMQGGEATVDFKEWFKYLDTMKLRSLFIPDQALIEGNVGGSRNVAGTMSNSFHEAQYNIKAEIDLFINKYVLPQLVARNFPEFVANGGTCQIVTTGFDSSDTAFTKEIIQLVGQSDPAKLGEVDIRAALDKAGIPLKSVTQLQAEVDNGSLTTTPQTQAPAQGQAGIAETDTGFTYIQPRESITINLAEDEYFNDKSPDVPYFNNDSKRYLKEAYANLQKRYNSQYRSAANFVRTQPDLPLNDRLGPKAAKRASEIAEQWAAAQPQDEAAFKKAIAGIIAIYILFRKGKSKTITQKEVTDLTKEYVASLKNQIDTTTKDEISTFIANQLKKNKTFGEISAELMDNFAETPKKKAMRVIRTEAREIYNDSVMANAETQGLKTFLVHDALLGPTDQDCEVRDGKVIDAKEALTIRKEIHPNCTFYLEAIKDANFSLEEVDPEFVEGAYFSDEESTLFVNQELSPEDKSDVIKQAIKTINSND